jgi:outer membrane lipoprotein carrier protein
LNQRQQEQGHLYLMRPRMMRWEYKNPEEKLFVSDGKTVYWYVPADKQVRTDQVRDAIDDRIPLMFLIGRTNLRGEFTRFETMPGKPVVPGTVAIKMVPKRKTDLTQLIMEVDPSTFHIRRLVMAHADGSRSDFVFSNIRLNTKLQESLFKFKIPPGVRVQEGIGQ